MTTAAEVWRRLIQERVLRPKSYDKDIVTLLESQLPGSKPLAVRMEAAGWTARDLLRAMSPVVDSFAGLMRDLLSLYNDIDATRATTENLILSYEFDEGEVFDQSLMQFRSAVATLDRVQAARGAFVLSTQRWEYPSAKLWSPCNANFRALRGEDEDEWRFTLPVPPEVDDPEVARGVSLVYAVLTASCDTLRNYGATMHAVSNNPALQDRKQNELAEHRKLFFDFTDFFPEVVILRLRADVEHLASRPSNDVNKWLREIEIWCSSFWGTEVSDAASALDSVLSLPMWGKRHELYSTWVVCIIAKAFKGQKLQFEVVNGRLSFPFKATKIASFEDPAGQVELWSEVRSAASGVLAHGRKQGVQPDYRFQRPGQAPHETDMAIEVKQYRSAAASRHGDTARDYARALPLARVAIVAHGPIGNTAMNRVDVSDRDRVSFRENVRSLVSAESKALIEELAGVFPPLAPHVLAIKAGQSRVHEVEVLLITLQQESVPDTILHRGIHIQALDPSTEAEIVLEIVCHPERGHTIDGARPFVTITFSYGDERRFEAVQPNLSTSWHVGTLSKGSFIISGKSVESVG
ncbi:hypothetical protein CIK76_03645 [Glutamicibacter sp. BW80]|nr:hypothetical protein CIK76_03645 [Glutamicibacter sp. BW80]